MIKYLLVFFTFLNFVNCQNYSYYKLGVQKWCTDKYQIHGLWPQFSTNEYPSYCNKDPYIEPSGLLKKEMIKYWSSCNNTDLWEHEWIKHGTCYEEFTKNDEFNYFNKTIQLFKIYNKLLVKCFDTECIMACFDLKFNLIECKDK